MKEFLEVGIHCDGYQKSSGTLHMHILVWCMHTLSIAHGPVDKEDLAVSQQQCQKRFYPPKFMCWQPPCDDIKVNDSDVVVTPVEYSPLQDPLCKQYD